MIKKTLSFLVLLFSVTFIFAQDYAFVVYFKRPSTWTTNPKMYIFNSPEVPDSSWPGDFMTATCTKDWYIYKAPVGTTSINFVINNGSSGTGNQTQDLSTTGTVYYVYDTTNATEPATIPTTTPVVPNPCISINRDSGTWFTGTNVPVTIEARDYLNNQIPKIYYTQDGSTPTTGSTMAPYSTHNLSYNSGNNILRAIAVNDFGTSTVEERTYNFTTEGIKVHLIIDDFLPSWLYSNPKIHYWNVQTSAGNPTISDSVYPGVSTFTEGTNQYYYFFPFATSVNFLFNNGSSGAGNQTSDYTNITSEVWVHYPSGTLSTSPITSKDAVNIHPNPVADYLKIEASKNFVTVEIIDLSGKLVSTAKLTNSSLNVSNLTKGTYLLKMIDKDGKSITKKFIKK